MNRTKRRQRPSSSRTLRLEPLESRHMFAGLSEVANDPFFERQYYLEKIEAPAAWTQTTGNNVVVAVIDSGVDLKNKDLKHNIWTNPREIPNNGRDDDGNGLPDDVHGFDFADWDSDPSDQKGHGTHMAGIIAAEKDNGLGIAGIAPDAKILPLRVSRTEGGHEKIDWQAAIKAIDYATDMRLKHGVNIRVIAFSGITDKANLPGKPLPALRNAIERAGRAGILFVTSAGNYNVDNDKQTPFPASYPSDNIISVAASDPQDRYWRLSNHGETTVDLAAPGSSIASTYPNRTTPVTKSGTSFAAPQVAGVAALAFSLKPNATPAEVKQAILQGVDPMNDTRKATATDGRLNARRTLNILTGTAAPRPPVPQPNQPSNPPPQNPGTPPLPTPTLPQTRVRSLIEAPRQVNTSGSTDVRVRLVGLSGGTRDGLAEKQLTLWLRVPTGKGQYTNVRVGSVTTDANGFASFRVFAPLNSSTRNVFDIRFAGDDSATGVAASIIVTRRCII